MKERVRKTRSHNKVRQTRRNRQAPERKHLQGQPRPQ